ncbi:MAG: hypothetical protein RAK24_05140, partial [TACK group archaeon]|nr:hypothetical protein [TACK group archaeon]
DGVCSAALAKRYLSTDPYVVFTGPKSLAKSLERVREGHERVIITDVGLNHDQADAVEAQLKRLSDSKVIWVDHHEWEKEDLERMGSLCELTVEPSPSAASLFFKKYGDPQDEIGAAVAAIGDDADTNTNALPNTLAYKHGTWDIRGRIYLVNALARGELEGEQVKRWKQEVDQEIQDAERLVSGLKPLVSVSGKRYAVLDMRGRKASGTYAAKLAAQRLDLDFAVVIYSCSSVSFYRGLRDTNLLSLALKHNGGGHTYACGANPRPGLLDRFACFLMKHRMTGELSQIVREAGELRPDSSPCRDLRHDIQPSG